MTGSVSFGTTCKFLPDERNPKLSCDVIKAQPQTVICYWCDSGWAIHNWHQENELHNDLASSDTIRECRSGQYPNLVVYVINVTNVANVINGVCYNSKVPECKTKMKVSIPFKQLLMRKQSTFSLLKMCTATFYKGIKIRFLFPRCAYDKIIAKKRRLLE